MHTTETQDCLKSQEGAEGLSECQRFLQADNDKVELTSNSVEISGDLFDTDSETHLVKCVSADFKMNKGIALKFRRKFGNIP